jgi:hypothetical protein
MGSVCLEESRCPALTGNIALHTPPRKTGLQLKEPLATVTRAEVASLGLKE